jgi:hypothetical protein
MIPSSRLRIVFALAATSLCCKGSTPSKDVTGTPPGDLSPVPDRPPTPVGQTITTVRVQNLGSTGLANVPVTFALPFRRGDVPAAHFVVARAAGEGLATQLDRKVSYADGSLRHGILTASIPSLGPNETRTLELAASPTSGASGEPLSIDALLAAGFSSEVAPDPGTVARFTRTSDAWLAGPLASEWTSVADVTADGRPLSVRFDVRWYGGGRARVAVTVENAWAFGPGPRNVSYEATIRVGGRDAWSSGAIQHYAQARWRRVTWWGDPVDFHVAHDPAYVISTGTVAAYDTSIEFGARPSRRSARSGMGSTRARCRRVSSRRACPRREVGATSARSRAGTRCTSSPPTPACGPSSRGPPTSRGAGPSTTAIERRGSRPPSTTART